jgi:hypothetical protein
MSQSQGLRQVGFFDCAGGGQVIVQNDIAYVGHMRSPHRTSIIDACDPANCRELATFSMALSSMDAPLIASVFDD